MREQPRQGFGAPANGLLQKGLFVARETRLAKSIGAVDAVTQWPARNDIDRRIPGDQKLCRADQVGQQAAAVGMRSLVGASREQESDRSE